MYAAIPTTYKSVRFRSRLEAKWAAMFDLLGWDWQYEPFDLNGWIPDFVLTGKTTNILVEVKPTDCFLPDIADEMEREGARIDYDLMLCGYKLVSSENDPIFKSVGWTFSFDQARYNPHITWHDRFIWSNRDGRFDIIIEGAPYRGVFYGDEVGYHGKPESGWSEYGGAGISGNPSDLEIAWAKAGNLTQWKAPK